MDKSINHDKLMRDVNKYKCKSRIERELDKEDKAYKVVNTKNTKKKVTIDRLNYALDSNVNHNRLTKNNCKKKFIESVKPYVVSQDEFGNIIYVEKSSNSKKNLTDFSKFIIIFIIVIFTIIFFMEYNGFAWQSSLF